MKPIFYTLACTEYWCAVHLGAAGEWWAARAARRCGKFSPDNSGDV